MTTEDRKLHIRPIVEANQVEATHFVLRRDNGHWSTGAKIVAVCPTEAVAKTEAERLKTQYPNLVFGVAPLLGEAQIVQKPVEFVECSR